MFEAIKVWGRRVAAAALRMGCAAILVALALAPVAAHADDKAKLFATTEKGFGRLILDFPTRLDLPKYQISSDNGVLALTFDEPIDFSLPDVAAALPGYITIARVDPDHRGIRFGMRGTFSVDHIDAGEQLFVDLLPSNWQGLPPGLPQQVVADLAARAKESAIQAEQARKAEEAKRLNPQAQLRIGHNPTFIRLQFDWNMATEAKFASKDGKDTLQFDWPVPVDVSALKADLPPELKAVENVVSAAGSSIVLAPAKGVTPRFYALSNQQFVIDIDTASIVPKSVDPQMVATRKAFAAAKDEAQGIPQAAAKSMAPIPTPGPITPTVRDENGTVRVTFPFHQDTPAAVFRRGNTLWMLFDTLTGIKQPAFSAGLASLAKAFTVLPAGDAQVVRIDLDTQKLATLGSEGRSWVLSLGNNLLMPTEPLILDRRQDKNGLYQITADLGRPAKVHQFRDPVVGDLLTVVTAYPPSRGSTRDLGYVDFEALRSIHGLVIKPEHPGVHVSIEDKLAVISTPGGLIVSPPDPTRNLAVTGHGVSRADFVDLATQRQSDPTKILSHSEKLMADAGRAEGSARDEVRLKLARFYLANRLSYEAIGVLGVLNSDEAARTLLPDAHMTLGIADTMAGRPADALAIFDKPEFSKEIDVRVWRAIARAEAYDYKGALTDAEAGVGVVRSYPVWVQDKFLLAAERAAVETGDPSGAERFAKRIDFATLDPEQATDYQVLSGRIAEMEGRTDEALDTYGQVIAADIRPTRAEAIYRTILILDESGKLDLGKATKTLASETLMWRGNPLEAKMDSLLAKLYFRNHQYREGLQTVKQTVQYFPDSPVTDALSDLAQKKFVGLFLNGEADRLDPTVALSLYYDFRDLTPPGAQGDEMIRELAQRLVKVDLLGQAADLLHYQVTNRLTGAARAEVATQLALIDIADRKPVAALNALGASEMSDLPPSLERRRRVLRARALIDAKRYELALDLLTPVEGRDADLLRVEGYWDQKDYEKAGRLLEVMYSPDGSGRLDNQSSRLNVVKAAVAYALANDKIGLSRLRAKFSDAMSKTAEWPMFDYLTGKVVVPTSGQFKTVAKVVAAIDPLDAFLAAYRHIYGEGKDGMTPMNAVQKGLAEATRPPSAANAG